LEGGDSGLSELEGGHGEEATSPAEANGELIGDGGRGLDGQHKGGEELRQGAMIQQVIMALIFLSSFIIWGSPLG
jgi:hypothetical protein